MQKNISSRKIQIEKKRTGNITTGAMSDGAMSDGCKAKYEAHLKEILDLLTLSLIKKAFSKVRLKKSNFSF